MYGDDEIQPADWGDICTWRREGNTLTWGVDDVDEQQNGQAKQPPTIRVVWDAATQRVAIGINTDEFLNLEMAKAVLSIAVDQLEANIRRGQTIALMQEMAQAQMEAQRSDRIARQILQG